MDHETLSLITIPLFTGVIGYTTNWTGVWMMFHPIRFHGFRVPGLRALSNVLPRKIQQIPGVMQGGVGWQGIIPSRAAKMGSIAVDKGIAKLGSPADFYRQLEPETIGDHIDQLLDVKLMVIRRIEEHPELANRIFLEVGRRELRFIINFGFFFGAILGFPMVYITEALPY